jgi:hypothetical protein
MMSVAALELSAVDWSSICIFLYFFLAAVSDQHGLSFYGDGAIAIRLRMAESMNPTASQGGVLAAGQAAANAAGESGP